VSAEERKSGVFKMLLTPSRIEIKAAKVKDELWSMDYTEWFDGVDPALLDKAFEDTKPLAERMGWTMTKDGNAFKVRFEAPLEVIASGIVTEFISVSYLGDITLRDIFILGGLNARAVLNTSKKEAGKE